MANAVMSSVDCVGLDLTNCREESYDNPNNLYGLYKGLQCKIESKSNDHIPLVPIYR